MRTKPPDPSAFPIGSPESRAAARQRAEAIHPTTKVLSTDREGNPIWDQGAVYGVPTLILNKDTTRDEWLEMLRPRKDPAAELEGSSRKQPKQGERGH